MSTTARIRLALLPLLAALAALALAGCGISDPYAKTTATSTAPHVVDNEVQPAHPYHDTRVPATVSTTPEAALARFADLYINWTYRNLAAHQQELAGLAVGAASAAEQQAVQQTKRDYELRQGKVANSGQVISIAPRRGGGPHDYTVVTRERTSGDSSYDGLPANYHVTLATVRAVGGGWAVSAWSPQS